MKQSAKSFAIKAHKGQKRKISNMPYITHPIRVANLLESAGLSDELICAAYLHDVVEDTPYKIDDIEEKFGRRVAELVASHTEDKSKSWEERKQHTIDLIKNTETEVKYLIIADRLDNLFDLENDLKTYGHQIWHKFNAGYEKQKWYNESLAKYMYDGLSKDEIPSFFKAFEEAIKRIFHD